jgi:hypothetical protein
MSYPSSFGVGSDSHAKQAGMTIIAFEQVVRDEKFEFVYPIDRSPIGFIIFLN